MTAFPLTALRNGNTSLQRDKRPFPTPPCSCFAPAMPDSGTHARWPAYARVPPFLPVPVRARADGWTVERQGRFIGLLAETG